MKEGEGICQEHICPSHRHRLQCDDGQRERMVGDEWRQAKGVDGDSCIKKEKKYV